MSITRTIQRNAGQRRGVKSLIVALSVAATIGGWAVIASSQPPQAVAAAVIAAPISEPYIASATVQTAPIQDSSSAATPTTAAQPTAPVLANATPTLRKVQAPQVKVVRKVRPRPVTVTRSSR